MTFCYFLYPVTDGAVLIPGPSMARWLVPVEEEYLWDIA